MRDKEGDRILNNSKRYYDNRPKECSFHNWVARIVAFVEFGKKVWPEPSEKEIEACCFETGYKIRRRCRDV